MPQPATQDVFRLAVQHHQAGRVSEAESLYRQILAEHPENADALFNLGLLAHQTGRNDLAVELIRRGLAVRPDYAEGYSNLGNALSGAGQTDAAIAAFQQAIALNPNLPQVHTNLGSVLRITGQLPEAIAACRQAVSLQPNYAEGYCNLGNALADDGQLDEAIAALQRAIALNPNLPQAHSNLGSVLMAEGRLDEAIAACRQAIALRPDYAEAHSNLGNVLADSGRVDDAITACRKAISLNPGLPEAHDNLALCLLRSGQLEEGWREREWRWKVRKFPSPPRSFAQPQWDGSDLTDRTLLVHAEQGFGDTIQFLRYVPLLARRGAKIILELPADLNRLCESLEGEARIVKFGQPLPPFDFHCPILSLPLAFKTTLNSIPGQVPHLFAEPGMVEHWRKRLAGSGAGLKVALAWAGNPNFKADRTRSISLDRLAPLSQVAGVTFFSLQKGAAAAQAIHPPPGLRLIDLSPDLHDFADTAAAMAAMDLVITTDTSVAHLAGALARPVWVMLQLVSDWRWLLERDDSPWYPTMRLFRQTSLGDWPGVIGRVCEGLSEGKIG
jgi:tetratricopeptide (TPR) repeat protein